LDVPENEWKFENIFIPYSHMESDFETVEGSLSVYYTMEDDALREATEAAGKEFSAFERELLMNKDLYDTFVGWKAKAL
jgi:Zn-dependent oligopeptidase